MFVPVGPRGRRDRHPAAVHYLTRTNHILSKETERSKKGHPKSMEYMTSKRDDVDHDPRTHMVWEGRNQSQRTPTHTMHCSSVAVHGPRGPSNRSSAAVHYTRCRTASTNPTPSGCRSPGHGFGTVKSSHVDSEDYTCAEPRRVQSTRPGSAHGDARMKYRYEARDMQHAHPAHTT